MKQTVDLQHHERRFDEPDKSTVAFCDWLEAIGYIRKDSRLKVIDLGSGDGANIFYMAKRFPNSTFIGVDIDPYLVMIGNKLFQDKGVDNCRLDVGDICSLDKKYVSQFDGIVSFRTLSWLPEYKKPIIAMSKLNAKWIALSSLFYDGPISWTVKVQDYDDATLKPEHGSYCNIYSLPVVSKLLSETGYSNSSAPFEAEKFRSGPLHMPWYFIAGEKQQQQVSL